MRLYYKLQYHRIRSGQAKEKKKQILGPEVERPCECMAFTLCADLRPED